MSIMKKVLPEDKVWVDRRLINISHSGYAYRTDPADTLEKWRGQKDFIKSQVAMAAGLKPLPRRVKPEANIGVQHKFEGTVIANVKFESMPGSIVTGTLFMPERVKSQAPGILCPHGHLEKGRLNSDAFNNIPLFCQMMARLGFIVFSYDMPGYNDSNEIMHCWPEDMRRSAMLSGVSPFGIQTINSLQALDFLCNLPEVDERRIGVVGHGGGAFQSMVAALLDERVKVLALSGVLSSHCQGECECEEGPLLRINSLTSFDMLSACAPRPLFLASSSQDGTSQNPVYEVPALMEIYNLLDSGDALLNYHQNIAHSCPKDTREHIYPWLTHWLLNQSLRETIPEDDIQVLPERLMIQGNGGEPTPLSTQKCIKQIGDFLCANGTPLPKSQAAAAKLRKERRALAGDFINSEQGLVDVACRVTNVEWSTSGGVAKGRLISRRDSGDIIPAVEITPPKNEPERPTVLLVSGNDKADFFAGGNYATVTDALVGAGCRCWAIDLLGSGETAAMPSMSFRDESEPSFFAFNQSLFAMRTQDILTALQMLRENVGGRLAIVSTNSAARQVLCALTQVQDVNAAVIDMNGLDDSEEAWMSLLDFQPMIFKLGGIKGLLALTECNMLGLFNPSNEVETYLKDFYDVLGNEQKLYVSRDTFLRLAEHILVNL